MKLWVELVKGLNKIELVFDTKDYNQLENLLIANGYRNWQVVDWQLKEIEFIK
jgi:hypothetical protein